MASPEREGLEDDLAIAKGFFGTPHIAGTSKKMDASRILVAIVA
jgi:hypothetical protein